MLAGTIEALRSVALSSDDASGHFARWGGEHLFRFSLDRVRTQAWRAAARIGRLSDDERATDAAELDRLVSVLACLIASPGPVATWLLTLLRRVEEQDPRTVTRQLLGGLR